MSLFRRSIRFGAVRGARLLKCEHMSLRYRIPAARTQCPQAGRPSNSRSFCARLPQGQTNFDHAPPFGNLRCTIATTNSTPLSPLSKRMVAARVSGPISPVARNRDARTTGRSSITGFMGPDYSIPIQNPSCCARRAITQVCPHRLAPSGLIRGEGGVTLRRGRIF
jgi:hypothetical protein